MFQACRVSRELVLRHSKQIRYGPGSKDHALLGEAATRRQALLVQLTAGTEEQDAWVAAVCTASLNSA
eukprot:CAMPEP_0202879070 /NCGR_PEP_ID=MMETSP1391-20130828/33123_1 /ASSEMBLY_ACC=CAM_ASM_000867 /TAXON_ID=1034604 /ORGANISM="Chlamydomonas leiostraca, Strain SAG 11-49" /LENGTH=67 /DNA_ID=CAMNT_0049561373 /DNA_START=10 /DNA_END=210 /DNA_ORIENTATION=+